jgi:hypothetical protein
MTKQTIKPVEHVSNKKRPTGKQTETWEKEFDEKVNELRRMMPEGIGETKIVDFGYKLSRDGEEVFTVTDFGNIKVFIRTLLKEARKELLDKLGDGVKELEIDIDGREAIYQKSDSDKRQKYYDMGINHTVAQVINLINKLKE